MGSISGVQADVNLLRETYKKMTSLGEVIKGQDFKMSVEGYSDLEFVIQSSTTPPTKREVVETYGPFGVKSIQQGRFMNEVEMQITFKETISGVVYAALTDWAKNKKYLDVTLELISESLSTPIDPHTWLIEDCWIELDGADLSVEDAVPLKPSGTLHGSYFPA